MIHTMPTAEKAASAPVPISAPAMPCSMWILVPKPKNPIAAITAVTSPTSPALAADQRKTAMRKMINASGAVAINPAIPTFRVLDLTQIGLEPRRHEPPARKTLPIIVRALHVAFGDLHLLPNGPLVGNQIEQVTDTVE